MVGILNIGRSQRGSSGVHRYETGDDGKIHRIRFRRKTQNFARNLSDKEQRNFRILTQSQAFYSPPHAESIFGSLDIYGEIVPQPLRYIVKYVDDGHYVLGVELEPDNFMRVMAFIKEQVALSEGTHNRYIYSPTSTFPKVIPISEISEGLSNYVKRVKPEQPIFMRRKFSNSIVDIV